MTIIIDLKFVGLLLLALFIGFLITCFFLFVKAIFRFPKFRYEFWRGITNGDEIPHQEDYHNTSKLIWAYLFGAVNVIVIFLWISFPNDVDWKYLFLALEPLFFGCLGLKLIGKK